MGKKSLRKHSRLSKRNGTFRKTRKHRINHRKKSQRKNRRNKMRGGFGPGAGPVGYPLDGGNTSTWPGVSGNDQGMGNHYAISASGIPSGLPDPPISSRGIPEPFSSSMKYGGRKKRRHNNRQRGGGLIPQGLLDLGRSVQYNTSSFFSRFMGDVNNPVNPMPTKDQVIDDNSSNNNNININRAFNDNNTNNMNNSKFSSLYDIAKNSYNKTAAIK